jgi:glutaredoxin
MKNIVVFISLWIGFSAFAQEKQVEFQIKKGNNRITFKGINKSDFDQEVVLYFNSIQGLYGYSKPITKVIPAKSKLEFIELRFSGKYSYNYSFRTKSKPTAQQKRDWEKKVATYEFQKNSNIDEGIVVFSRAGCSRCKISIDYFIQNKVNFQIVDITTKNDYKNILRKKLEENEEHLKQLPIPFFLVDGKLYHSFKDLNKFLKKLKKKYRQ